MIHRLIIVVGIVMSTATVNAQSSVGDVQFNRVPGDNSSIISPLDSVFEVTCLVELTDSVNIAKIHLTRSQDINENNVVNSDTLHFLNNSDPDIVRNGLVIEWEAGVQSTMQRYYYIIKLEDFVGNVYSTYVKQ